MLMDALKSQAHIIIKITMHYKHEAYGILYGIDHKGVRQKL